MIIFMFGVHLLISTNPIVKGVRSMNWDMHVRVRASPKTFCMVHIQSNTSNPQSHCHDHRNFTLAPIR